MTRRRLQFALAFASIALVLTAAAVSRSDQWNFDFAQYKGPERVEPKDEFRFVMVGDRTGGRVPLLMPQAFREINYLYPDFVICVGDLIDGAAPTNERTYQLWKEFDDEVALLKSPFVYLPGNHDVWNASSKGIYEERYGQTYRSFDYRGLHFITLDTEEFDEAGRKFDRIDGKQLEWLKDDIARNRNAKAILVLMHKPIWLSGGLAKAEEVWKGLPVYVFAGHVHRYSYQLIDGIPHIILGAVAGGMGESGDAIGRIRHYMLVTVRDGKLDFGLIRLGGVLAPETVLEEDQAGIRLLAEACAVVRDGDEAAGQLIFSNPLTAPVKLQVQRTGLVSGKPTAQLVFRGSEPTVAAGEVIAKPLDGATLAPPAAGVSPDLKVICEFANSQGQPQRIDFPIEPRRRRTALVKPRAAAPTIDGDLSDWADADWQSIAEPSQVTSGANLWKSPDDLSARFAVTQDEQNIYIAVQVTDDFVQYHLTPADSDGIEIFTASPAKGEISFSRDADWHRLVITPFSPDGQSPGDPTGPARITTSGGKKFNAVRAAYAREMKSYVIELAISRQELGWSTDRSAANKLEVAVNDRDLGTRRESQLKWSSAERDQFSSRHFGQVRLSTP